MSTTTASALLRYVAELRDRPVFSAALTLSIIAVWIGVVQVALS